MTLFVSLPPPPPLYPSVRSNWRCPPAPDFLCAARLQAGRWMDHHCPAETLRSGQNDGTRLVLLHWKCLNVYTQAACFVLILTADLLEMVSVMSSVSSPSADRRRQSRITVSCKSLWMTSGNALSTKYLFAAHTHTHTHTNLTICTISAMQLLHSLVFMNSPNVCGQYNFYTFI